MGQRFVLTNFISSVEIRRSLLFCLSLRSHQGTGCISWQSVKSLWGSISTPIFYNLLLESKNPFGRCLRRAGRHWWLVTCFLRNCLPAQRLSRPTPAVSDVFQLKGARKCQQAVILSIDAAALMFPFRQTHASRSQPCLEVRLKARDVTCCLPYFIVLLFCWTS